MGREPLRRGAALGRYLVLERLGEGGMGVVYTAYDPELDRKVAVKLLHPEKDGEAGARLLREAQAMARLAHPNVIAVHDVGTLDGEVFVAMELVDGPTLGELVAARKPSWREVLALFRQAGEGLAAAHAQGLVHRDFKPGNVLVGGDGRVRVLDFGLARAAGAAAEAVAAGRPQLPAGLDSGRALLATPLTRTGFLAGTPAYMAPEQFEGRDADARSDQFSFCVALWECLYGERPFAGATFLQLADAVREGRVEPVPAESAVPAWVHRIVLRGLSARPEARHPSMAELLAALADDPARRRRRWLAAAGAALLLAAAAGGVALLLTRQDRLCKGAERRLAGIWDAPRKAAARAAFLATGLPYAADAWSAAERELDGWATGWVTMRTDACEATRVRGEQSEQLLDLRMQCLDERAEELRALTGLFAAADAAVVERAAVAVSKVSPVAPCADTVALSAPERLPAAPEERAKVDEVRRLAAEAKALVGAGKLGEALVPAQAAVAVATAWRPARAEAFSRLGDVQQRLAEIPAAEASLLAALWEAVASGHERAAATVAADLAWIEGVDKLAFAEAERWARYAEAAVDRLRGAPDLRSRVLHTRGVIASIRGDFAAALALHQEDLELRRRISPDDDREVSIAWGSIGNALLGLARYDEAVAAYRRSLAIDERLFGPRHPDLAWSLLQVADALRAQGEFGEARQSARRALAVLEGALPADHPRIAFLHLNLGRIAEEAGELDEALAENRRALALFEQRLGPDHADTGAAVNNVGVVLWHLGRYEEGLALSRRALAVFERALGPEHPNVSHPLVMIGRQLLGLGRSAEAIVPLERALALRSRKEHDAGELAEVRFDLAQALWESGRDRVRARALADEARDGYRASGKRTAGELARVESWLAARGAAPSG